MPLLVPRSWSRLPRHEKCRDCVCRLSRVLVFPNPDHQPVCSFEGRLLFAIPSYVAIQLWAPVPWVRLRRGSVVGTAVPETAVDEDGQPGTEEDDVGAGSTIRCDDEIVLTEAQAPSVKSGAEEDLRPSIALAIRSHDGCHRR